MIELIRMPLEIDMASMTWVAWNRQFRLQYQWLNLHLGMVDLYLRPLNHITIASVMDFSNKKQIGVNRDST